MTRVILGEPALLTPPGWRNRAGRPIPPAREPLLVPRFRYRAVGRVNDDINGRFCWIPDPGRDQWRALEDDDTGGDCEDFALRKVIDCILAGIDPEDLFIGVCKDRKLNAMHAVMLWRDAYGNLWIADQQEPFDSLQPAENTLDRYAFAQAMNLAGAWNLVVEP